MGPTVRPEPTPPSAAPATEPSRLSRLKSLARSYLALSLPSFIGVSLAAIVVVVLVLVFVPLALILLSISLVAAALGSWWLTAALGLRRASAIACGWSVIFCAQLVILVLVVGGALRQLNPVALTISSLVLGAAEVGAVGHWAPPAQAGTCRLMLSALRHAGSRAKHHRVLIVLGLVVLAQYLLQVVVTLWVPPFSYDSVYYHLIAPDTWIQHGAIVHSPQRLAADVYPQDQEAISAFVGTFLQTLRYAGLTQLPFAAMAAAAVALLVRALGVRRSYAALAALAFLAMPAVFLQAPTAYVDVAAAATVLAALAFLLAAPAGAPAEGPGSAHLIPYLAVAGTATGLAAGVKSTNVALVPMVVIIALIQHWRAGDRTGGSPGSSARRTPVWAVLAWVLVPIVALAATWYIRTWITYGNPFYPVSILGFKGLGSINQVIIQGNEPLSLRHAPLGVVGSVFSSWIYDLHAHRFIYDQRLGGFGPQWILLGVPALAVCMVAFARRRRDYLFGLILPVLVLAVASQAAWWARYTMALAGVGCVCLAWCLESLSKSRLRLRLGAPYVAGALVALSGLAMWWATHPLDVPILKHGSLTQATMGDLVSMIDEPVAERYRRTYPWYAYQALSVVPVGSVVAETDFNTDPFAHPVVGDRLQRRLVLLGAPASTAGLTDQMTRAGARYLLLAQQGSGAGLYNAVARDTSQFKLLAHGETVNGQSLYELGSWGGCGVAQFRLGGSPSHNGGALSVGATLEDGCGPVADVTVALWQGPQANPVWHGAKVIATVATDASGHLQATIARPLATARYFLRYDGGVAGGKTHEAAASPIFTPAQIP